MATQANFPKVICRVKALYAFSSPEQSSLTFEKDDLIDVLSQLDSGWWDGWCGGRRGWFPSNYVELSNDDTLPFGEEIPTPYDDQDDLPREHYRNQGGLGWTHPTHSNSDDSNTEEEEGQRHQLDELDQSMSLRTDTSSPNGDRGENSDIMSHWVEKTTAQGKVYFGNYVTEETTWDYNEIDPTTGYLKKNGTNKEASGDPQTDHSSLASPMQPLTWKSVSATIAQSVSDLNTTLQQGERSDVFRQRVNAVVDAVRFMLYSSKSLDKEAAPHLQHPHIKELHRHVLSALAKMILTSKTILEPNATRKMQRDAAEVLSCVRKFVVECQSMDVTIEAVFPRLVCSLEESTITQSKYPLNQDLVVSLQTHAKQIVGSAEVLLKASMDIYTLEKEQHEARSSIVVLFRTLSSQAGDYLEILGDIDTTQIDPMLTLPQFCINKQHLFESIGLLFNGVQSFTDVHIDLIQSIASIEKTIQQIKIYIDQIHANIANMVIERKAWLISHDVVMTEEPKIDFQKEDGVVRRSRQNSTTPGILSIHQRKASSGHSTIRSMPTTTDESRRPSGSQHSGSLDSQSNLWFLGYDYSEGDLALTMEKGIKGGTLRALVERLTLHDFIDMSFIANFLLTYRSFCTTEEFIDLLQERYNLAPPEQLTPAELVIWAERKQKLIRLRVFNIMKMWLENYYNDEDAPLLDQLQIFANTVICDSSSFSADQLNRLIRKRRDLDANVGVKKLIPHTMAGPAPILQKNLETVRLLETDTLELARQLTLMDFKHYSRIRPVECLGKAWSDDQPEVAPNVKQSIDYCNKLTSWVTGCILSHKDPKKRVIAIKYWAQVASRCLEMNNYNTCMAVISAFDNSAVGRLKKTWDLVTNRTLQSLASIRKLMGSNRNYIAYREMIHSVNPPCIPFLGIYLQDLTFIEDGNPDVLKQSTHLINFAKQQKSAEVIREIKQFQSTPYIYQFVPEIQEFIKFQLAVSRDIDYLYTRSLELEPRSIEN